MKRIAVADIGGTNARFALADVSADGVATLGDPIVLPAASVSGLAEAWQLFGRRLGELSGEPLPRHAALGVAGPVTDGPVQFVNSHWVVDPATLSSELGLDSFSLVNDFGAMAHAVGALGSDHVVHLCGPDIPLPRNGAISVIGPGTGLGVAVLIRHAGAVTVLETEGSHIGFAPQGDDQGRVCEAIRARHGRCSIERVVSGPGLGEIVRAFSPEDTRDDAALWAGAEAGDPAMASALDLFLASYGAVVGDLSLAHGALGIALTGGLTNRIRQRLCDSSFHAAMADKGRYRTRMAGIPVKLVTHPQPGLFGAAAAYVEEHLR